MSDDVFTVEDLIRLAAEVGKPPQPMGFLVHPADLAHLEEHKAAENGIDCSRCSAIWATAQRVRL